MVDIMKYVQDNYIPYKAFTDETTVSTGEVVDVVTANCRKILFGGDQLTAARMRCAQRARMNSETPDDKLCGIVPVSEDWHIKANFLGVSYTYIPIYL